MKELITIQQKLKAPKGQYNSFGKYYFRSCENILEALKPLLGEQECYLILSDKVLLIGDRYYIEATATITNKDGKSISNTAIAQEPAEKKGMDAAQITGTSSSYARKSALNGLFAIDDTQDSDALNKHATSAIDYAIQLRECKTLEELKQVWAAIPVKGTYKAIKDEMKTKLSKK